MDFRNENISIYLKLQVFFVDQSILHVKEFIAENTRSYSFHWINGNSKLIKRWDNAPNHKDILTFPHHMHNAENKIEESHAITLKEVLEHIINKLKENH